MEEYYEGVIEAILPLEITNLDGGYNIIAAGKSEYNTVITIKDGEYIDIANPDRIINVLKPGIKPIISEDRYLYSLDEDTLVPYYKKSTKIR